MKSTRLTNKKRTLFGKILASFPVILAVQPALGTFQTSNTHAFFDGHLSWDAAVVSKEGSAIMTTDLTHVAIADNESWFLQVYQNLPATPGSNPVAFAALNLATSAALVWQTNGGFAREADLESCTALSIGGVRNIIWAASHSRSNGAAYRYNRHFFFRTTVNGAGNLVYGGIWPNDVDANDNNLTDGGGGAAETTLKGLLTAASPGWAAALPNGAAGWHPAGLGFNNSFTVGPNNKQALAAPFAALSISCGFNLEGLASSPLNALAYMGLRGPMYWTGAAPAGAGNANVAPNRALAALIPITNFDTSRIGAGPAGAVPAIGAPVLLDFDGRALRSIEYIRGQYVITAGGGLSSAAAGSDVADADNMALFTWSGNANDRPVQQLNSMIDPETGAGAGAEGLCEAPDIFGESLIQFVIDGDAGFGINQSQQTFLGRLQGDVRGVERHQWPRLEITARHAVGGADHNTFGVTAGGVAAVNYVMTGVVPYIAAVLPSLGGGAATSIRLEQQNVTAGTAFAAFTTTAIPFAGSITHNTARLYGQTIAVNLTIPAATMGGAGSPLLSGLLYRGSVESPAATILSRSENGVGIFRYTYAAANFNPIGSNPFISHISNDLNALMVLMAGSDTYSTHDLISENNMHNGFNWEDSGTALAMTSDVAPGKAFLLNMGTSAMPAITFLGEVPADSDLTTVRTTSPSGSNFTGCVSKSFLAGRLRTLGIRPLAGDRVHRYTNLNVTAGTVTSTFDGVNWAPAEPIVGVCDPFYIERLGAPSAVARKWQEFFKVWP